jgi:uncharacterized protein (TIGR01777 family)
MRFVLAGASGFLGTAWRDHLARQGHEVIRLVRGETMSPQESSWDPMRGQVDQDVIEKADVVACLSGANIAHVPWSASYKKTFVDSRLQTTGTLARAIARSERKPAFVAQNGISGYGDRGDSISTEDTPTDASGFMAQLTRDWEAATAPAAESGARVAVMRTAVVLDKRGGAFKPILLAFRAGVGGPLGPGDQYFSTISLTDWLRAATWLAENDDAQGAYNLSAPNQTTNREFGKVLGHTIHRPSMFKVPSVAIKAALSSAASDIIGSLRIESSRLPAQGFEFEHPTLESRIAAALNP